MKFWYDALDRETRKRVQKKNDAGSHQYYVNTYSEYDTAASGYFNTGRLTRQYTTGPGAHGIDFYYDKRGNLTQRVTEVDGKYYHRYAEYRRAGHLKRQTYHNTPGQTGTKWTPIIIHDTANRVETFGNYITGTTYGHDLLNDAKDICFSIKGGNLESRVSSNEIRIGSTEIEESLEQK